MKKLLTLLLISVCFSSAKSQSLLINFKTTGNETYLVNDIRILKYTGTDLNILKKDGNIVSVDIGLIGSLKFSNISTHIQDKNIEPISGLTLYPNPSKGDVTLSFRLMNDENINLEIFDLSGKTLQSIPVGFFLKGDHLFRFNLPSNIPNGIILVAIKGSDFNIAKTLLVQL